MAPSKRKIVSPNAGGKWFPDFQTNSYFFSSETCQTLAGFRSISTGFCYWSSPKCPVNGTTCCCTWNGQISEQFSGQESWKRRTEQRFNKGSHLCKLKHLFFHFSPNRSPFHRSILSRRRSVDARRKNPRLFRVWRFDSEASQRKSTMQKRLRKRRKPNCQKQSLQLRPHANRPWARRPTRRRRSPNFHGTTSCRLRKNWNRESHPIWLPRNQMSQPIRLLGSSMSGLLFWCRTWMTMNQVSFWSLLIYFNSLVPDFLLYDYPDKERYMAPKRPL